MYNKKIESLYFKFWMKYQFLDYSNFKHKFTIQMIHKVVCLPVANTQNSGKKGQNSCSTYYHYVASATVTMLTHPPPIPPHEKNTK